MLLSGVMMRTIIGPLSAYRISILLLMAAFLFSCVPQAKVPLDTLFYGAKDGERSRALIVFLPGNGDPLSAFEHEGIVRALKSRNIPADCIAVNAHLGYYVSGTFHQRLHEDVIAPARARGYDQIWLVGNSLGGYGSLSYALTFPGEITGIVLLGPFLGEKPLIEEIKRGGGVDQWDPGTPEQKEWERYLWFQIKACAVNKACVAKIFMGYGMGDRFALGQEYLADILLQDHVIVVKGGHSWSTWKTVWASFLDRGLPGLDRKYTVP